MTKLRPLLIGSAVTSPASDLGLLVLRLGIGISLALAHGLGKIPPSAGFVSATAAMGFPLPGFFAWAAALAEFAGGLLIAIGLFTRPAALFAAVTMGVAAFIRHAGDPFGDREMALLYGFACLALMLTGAGRHSVDAMLRRRLV